MNEQTVENVEVKEVSEANDGELIVVAKPLDDSYDLFSELNTVASQPDKYKEEHIHKLTKELINKLSSATKYKDPEILAYENKFAELEKTSQETINAKTQEYENKIRELEKSKEELESRIKNVNLGRMGKIYNEDSVANEKTNGNLDTWLSLSKTEQSKYFAQNKNLIKAN